MARVELSVRARPHGTCFRASPPAAKRPCRVCERMLMALQHRPQTMQTRASSIPGRTKGSRRSRDGPCLRVGAKVRRECLDPLVRGGPGSMRRVSLFRTRLARCLAPRRNCIKYAVICIMIRPLRVVSAHGGPGVFPISHASARRVLAPRRCTVYRDVLHRVLVLVPVGETAGTCCIYYIFVHIFAACSAYIRHVFAHLCAYIRYVFVRHRVSRALHVRFTYVIGT